MKSTQEKQKFETVHNLTGERNIKQVVQKVESDSDNFSSAPAAAETAGNNSTTKSRFTTAGLQIRARPSFSGECST